MTEISVDFSQKKNKERKEISVDQKNVTPIDLSLWQNKVDKIVEVIRLESQHWDVQLGCINSAGFYYLKC